MLLALPKRRASEVQHSLTVSHTYVNLIEGVIVEKFRDLLICSGVWQPTQPAYSAVAHQAHPGIYWRAKSGHHLSYYIGLTMLRSIAPGYLCEDQNKAIQFAVLRIYTFTTSI
jgi:hypothetical protein